MPTGRLSDNINDTITLGELITKLVTYPAHTKFMVSVTAANEFSTTPNVVGADIMEPLICAVEIEDIHFTDDGVLVISIGHEVLDRAYKEGRFD